MTAALPSRISPVGVVKTSAAPRSGSMSSFVGDDTYLESQTVKVYVRLKPSADVDTEDDKKNSKSAWNFKKTGAMDTLMEKGVLRSVEGKNTFHFDQVFDEEAKTPLLYKSIARGMVHTVLNGKHATIFAYGQTGSGKTFTMQGDGQAVKGQAGIIQLVVSDLFRFSRMGAQTSRVFTIKVAYVEIYNERIRDLLSDDAGDNTSMGTALGSSIPSGGPEVHIRTTATGEVAMNCVTKQVHTVEDVLELLVLGNSNRVVAKTDRNQHSSRSHAIFRLSVQSTGSGVGIDTELVRIADFNLVDLAGSESAKVTGGIGKRTKEGSNINKSLLSLSNVINNLSLPEKKRPKHINYRDSKLTRILQPHLSGNAEMAIICCACPSKAFVEETRSTLKFGSRAKLVTVKPKINELNDDTALIKKLQAELEMARQQIEQYKKEGVPENDRDEPVKRIEIKPQNTAVSDMNSQDNLSINYDEVSLGYDDMDKGPGHREYDYVSNQENPPPKNWEEGEKIPGMGGRAYVMPKNTQLPPELQEAGLAPEDEDEPILPAPPAKYVMPKNHELNEIPLDLGKDHGDNDNPDRFKSTDIDDILKTETDTESEDGMVGAVSADNFEGSAHFDMDMVVDPTETKAVKAYLQQTNNIASSADSAMSSGHSSGMSRSGHRSRTRQNHKGTSRHDQTGPTEDETVDGPERSFDGLSEKFGDGMSRPDTVRSVSKSGGRSKHTTIGTVDNFHARHGNQVSWDTMDLNIMQPEQAGRPLKAIQSLYQRETRLPEVITIMRASTPYDNKDELCVTDRLIDAEARANFMQGRLEMADDLVEGIFKDLERARLCIHDLVYRNAQLSAKLKQKHREDIKEDYGEKEVVLEQYWMLKGCMYAGLFFFISGGYEFFMASVFLVWLILEMNLGSPA